MFELACDNVSLNVLLRTSFVNVGPIDSISVEEFRGGKFDLPLSKFLKLPKMLYNNIKATENCQTLLLSKCITFKLILSKQFKLLN